MNSIERTRLTLEHKLADRIPIDFWATGAVIKGLEQRLGISYDDFLDRYDVDFRYIEGPAYIGPPLAPGVDIWGVGRASITAGADGKTESYSEVTKAPLADAQSAADVEAYDHWPDPDMFDYSVIAAQCEKAARDDRVVIFMGDRLNRIAQLKPAMYLRGAEEIFSDLVLLPDVARAIFRKIKEFYLVYLDRILDAANGKIDIVLTGDDFGAQQGLLLSADMWREFLKPGFAEFVDVIKKHQTIAMHHSCGSVWQIIPDMIESRLDVLQSIQPEADGMGLANLKKMFGTGISYQGGVSIQKTMPFGTIEEIRKEVKTLATAAKQDGGYIFCTSHNIQADTSIDSVLALMDAYHEFGRI
jgi:uroporphyrinogen decarboxylase